MLNINMSDVMNVINLIRGHLIAIGIVIVLAIVIPIAVMKLKEPLKYLIRSQSRVLAIVALVIIANLMCTGPLSTLLTLVSGSGTISTESQATAEELAVDIADEGIVLLKNDDNMLPMTDNRNLNVFGWASTNPVYGGTGSGSLSDAYPTVSLYQGLENAGFSLNSELSDFYTEYRAERPSVGMLQQDWSLPEPPVDTYSDSLLSNARDFSDTAMIVISRSGGENSDLPHDMSNIGSMGSYTDNSTSYQDFPDGTHYLELSQTERNLVDLVTENFENVIVVYNGSNTLELGFVNEYSQIKAAIWCPGTGHDGFNSLGSIMAGTVNPSAKTTDTFVADLTATPTYHNIGSIVYDNMDEFVAGSNSEPPHFVNYVENIYVGYRFYETASDEGLINYDEVVTYPFGYGLSYTTFTQEMSDLTVTDTSISVDVTVTNTGDTAGKDVVELYYNPPYTNGGIEKASVNLVAFDKTDLLDPGASQTLTLTFNIEDMASYDYQTARAYVLEAGDYEISIRSDSHTEIDSRTYTLDSTITYSGDNTRSTDLTEVTNQFDFAQGDFEFLSRADGFANYDDVTGDPASYSMTDEQKAGFYNNSNWTAEEDTSISMPTTGASNGLELSAMRGLDYDDEQWDSLLDQLTVSDMNTLISLAGYQTAAADSVGKVSTTDCDGPASINNNFTGVGSIGFPVGTVLANTFNEDLARQFGQSIGQMANDMGVSGWYAPAMNTHRSAFGGRNFEYYSEDPLLAGKISSQAVQGSAEYGVYACIKHFALNDQEAERWGQICTWSNEQAIREIYLKPFEICVKEGDAHAVMSSYNYIGNQWAGACSSLLNTVLRDEWGFEGFVLTDYFGGMGFMDATRSIYNGGNACLVNYDVGSNNVTGTDSATTVQHMRDACHGLLYTVVNSRAYAEGNINTGLLMYQIVLIVVDIVIAILLVLYEVFRVRKVYAKRRDSAKE